MKTWIKNQNNSWIFLPHKSQNIVNFLSIDVESKFSFAFGLLGSISILITCSSFYDNPN